MFHNVKTTYELSASDNRRLYKFQFTPAICNFHTSFIYFLSAYATLTITHAKINRADDNKPMIIRADDVERSFFFLSLPCHRTELNLIERNQT